MTNKKKIFLLIVFILFLCICCTSVVASYQFLRPKDGVKHYSITTSSEELLISKSIDAGGGEIYANELTGNEEIEIRIPEGSMQNSENISISTASINNSQTPSEAIILGDMVVLKKTTETEFEHPISVTLPFDKSQVDANQIVAVYEYIPNDNIIESTTMIDYDYEAGTVTFATKHFSRYLRISTFEENLKNAEENGFDTGFKPDEYGWYVRNWGSFETIGNCLGMSAVSKYYYNYKDKIGGTNLYNRYIEGNPTDDFDDTIGQELAGRVDVMLEPQFRSVRSDLARHGYNYNGIKNIYPKLIMQNMLLTGQPELLYIRQSTNLDELEESEQTVTFNPGINHALLAYKYKDGKMHLYDPNFPYRSEQQDSHNQRTVDFSFADGFGTYFSGLTSADSTYQFNTFIPFSSNFVVGNQKIQDLLKISQQGFPDNYYPEIEITKIETTDQGKVRVSGKVIGEKYKNSRYGKYIHLYLNAYSLDNNHPRTRVASDGSFSLETDVPVSDYTLHLLVADQNGYTQWSAYTLAYKGETSASPTEYVPSPHPDSNLSMCEAFAQEGPYDIPEGWLDGYACREYDNTLSDICADEAYWDNLPDDIKEGIRENLSILKSTCGLEK